MRYLSYCAAALAISVPAITRADDANQFLYAAVQTVQMLDQGRWIEVYDGASPVMKQTVPKDAFIANMADRIRAVSKTPNRDWISINKTTVNDPKNPGFNGLYATTSFKSQGTQPNAFVREDVTFRLEEGGRWMVAGISFSNY